MSVISKVGTTVLASLLLTSAAFAGNTSTSATLRLTVNVVPVVQVLTPAQDNASVIKFGDDSAQLFLGQQQPNESFRERINISHPVGNNVDGGHTAFATNATAVLLRQTYVAK